MNRLRSAYVFSVIACFTACSANSLTKSNSNNDNDVSANNPSGGGSSGTSVSGGDLDGGGSVSTTATGTSGGTGGPGGAGTVTTPPSTACGAGDDRKCELGEKCQTNADCASALCATQGPAAGTCMSAPSCTGGDGADLKCGPNGNEDCCHTIPVPGGSFNNAEYDGVDAPQDPGGTIRTVPSTVSPFALDEFEATVGRLRAFFTAKGGDLRTNHPATGDGAHPLHPGSGWQDSWNERLPGSWDEINRRLTVECSEGGDNSNWGAATWTAEAGANEQKPANCLDWYTMYAFCAWDGGRLPMDVEWSYVAMGGSQQLTYPYGNTVPTYENSLTVNVTSFLVPDAGYGIYTEGPEYRSIDDGPLHISKVGEKSGRSPWGHADMGGNVFEAMADMADNLPSTCNDCTVGINYPTPPQGANQTGQPHTWQATQPDGGAWSDNDFDARKAVPDGERLGRGGSWMGEYEGHMLDNVKSRYWEPVWRNYQAQGVRCARDIAKLPASVVDGGK